MKTVHRNSLIALAAALVLYGIAGFTAAPGLLRSALLESLGRTFVTRPSLGRVRVNPFALSVTLEQLSVPDVRGGRVAGFEALYVRFDPLGSLARGAWTLSELRLDRPAAALEVLEDRTLNLAHLLRPQSSPADTSHALPRFLVRHLIVREGELSYGDRSRRPVVRKVFAPIRLDLTDFGSRPDARNAYALEARTEAGEVLGWRGRFVMQPFSAQGEVHLAGVTANTLSDVLGDSTAFVLARGRFGFDTGYRFDAAREPATFVLSGMRLAAHDLLLDDRASGEEVIAAAMLETREGAFDAARLELGLGTVTVRGGHLHLWMQPDGHLNLEHWAQAPAAADSAPAVRVRIPHAELSGLAVRFEDRRIAPPAVLELSDGVADLRDFSTEPGSAFAASVTCSLAAGGRASLDGHVTPGTPAADFEVAARGLALRAVQPWVTPFARLDILSGTGDLRGRLQFGTLGAQGPLLRFTGACTSRDFAARDFKTGERLLAWSRLDLTGLEYDALPGRVVVRDVVATKPFARVVVTPDQTTNLQAVAVPPDSIPAAFRPTPGDTAVMPVRIDRVRVVDGSMRFSDLSLRPQFAIGIQGLGGEIRELSSAQAAHADVKLDGRVDAYAPVRIEGTINPLNSRGRTDVGMSFQNIELTSFTPYSGKFMGYTIERGKLDLDLRYHIENRILDAQNRVLMRQLTLGDRVESPDATHLPVRFAVALLKDRDGNINLNLPVKGSLDDPQFSVMPLVFKVLVGLVTKACASPFALLHAAFGGTDESSPAIRFPYGSAELDTAETAALLAVRKGLGEKPALRLEIEECADAERDSLALVESRYEAALRAAAAASATTPDPVELAAARPLAPPGFDPAAYSRSLAAAYVAQFGRLPEAKRPHRGGARSAAPDSAAVAAESARLAQMDARVRGALRLDPAELAGLGRRRARRIQGILLADSTVAPERVFIVGNKGTYRPDSLGVRLGLTLTD